MHAVFESLCSRICLCRVSISSYHHDNKNPVSQLAQILTQIGQNQFTNLRLKRAGYSDLKSMVPEPAQALMGF